MTGGHSCVERGVRFGSSVCGAEAVVHASGDDLASGAAATVVTAAVDDFTVGVR
jgi:hypothetical protein